MSDNNNNTTAAAAATSNNLDVLLLAVSMAAPSSGTSSSSATNSHMKTAVGPSMSAPKSTSDSHQLHANNNTSATLPLVTPPTSIELLDGHAAASDMPIFTEEPSADMKRSHDNSFFTSSSSSTLPAPKMTNNPSMFTNTNSLPIKKRFTNREGGPMVVSGTFATNGGSTRLQSDVIATTTTQTTSTAPLPLDTNTNNNTKKEKKKYRKPSCSHPSCPNRVMNRGVCARHGARVRICSIPECSKYAQKGGVCIRHGAKKEYKRCSVEGCNARASAAGSGGRSSSGGRKSVCSRHALTCYSVGSVVVVPAVAAAAVADGGTREEARQDVNSGRRIDEEEHQKQQQRETF